MSLYELNCVIFGGVHKQRGARPRTRLRARANIPAATPTWSQPLPEGTFRNNYSPNGPVYVWNLVPPTRRCLAPKASWQNMICLWVYPNMFLHFDCVKKKKATAVCADDKKQNKHWFARASPRQANVGPSLMPETTLSMPALRSHGLRASAALRA